LFTIFTFTISSYTYATSGFLLSKQLLAIKKKVCLSSIWKARPFV